MKKIAIAIPTYKRQELLIKLLESIPNEVQVVVSDNGAFVSESIKKNYKNTSFVVHEYEIGMFSNWNSAVGNSKKCDYIAIPSDDDIYIDGAFEIINKFINSTEEADIYIFGNNFINEYNKVIGSYCPKKYEVFQSPFGLKYFLYGVNALKNAECFF